MDTIKILFTKRPYNPISLLIRWALPRSRMFLALSSHCGIEDGIYIIEASMIGGVRRVLRTDFLKHQIIVKSIDYHVLNKESGLAWARTQICNYNPIPPKWMPECFKSCYSAIKLFLNNNYDFKGALGLATAPDRGWQEPDNWFCYEIAAGAIVNSGYDAFSSNGYITEAVLYSVNANLLKSRS